MFNLHSDRLDYRELLSPPPKYKVAFAVGTTYSLDLETLTATCAIVGLNVETDTELTKSPLYMLEAIRKASDNLLLFCQSGQIKTPNKPNKLLPLLENSVCEVSLKNKKSFHPKTWFIRYSSTDEQPDIYRLVVLSRNLTFDRSWDVALCLDSTNSRNERFKCESGTGKSIRNFLIWLSNYTRFYNDPLKKKRRSLVELAEELRTVKWKSLGKEFESFDFIPYGIDNVATDNFSEKFHKMFIISPFVSKSVIEYFDTRRLTNSDCTLITRKSELPKLGADLLKAFDTYTVKDDVVDGEERISESGTVKDNVADGDGHISEYCEAKTQDIHAKVYLRTKGTDSELYIGSANATSNALHDGNIECMLMLYGKQRYLNVDSLKADLGLNKPNDKNCPFERVKPRDYADQSEDATAQKLEVAIKEFCASPKAAVVSGENPYTVTVTLKLPQSGVSLSLSPLMRNNPQQINKEKLIFTEFALRELSEWYNVTAKKGGQELSRIVKIPTTGIPENRNSAIFSDIIKDQNSFLTYIAFLLSDDYLAAFSEGKKNGDGDFRFLNMSYDTPILYERMLKAAANSLESLQDVRKIIELTNEKNVPQDFVKLYEQFEKAVMR